MTAGVAIASWKDPKRPLLVVAADTRISRRIGKTVSVVNDASVKTLEVDDQVALAFSGDALPTLIAAEMTRTILRAQTGTDASKRLGFFDTARLLCHFLSSAAKNMGDGSETLVAGYFRSGAPGIARIRVTDEESVVSFQKCEPGGAIAFAIGPTEAKRLLLRGLEKAKQESKKLVLTSLALLEYMLRHEGETFTVGGQLSVGACDALSSRFRWPALAVGKRTYWRGVDVTGNWPPEWEGPVRVEYDEAWCAGVDQDGPPLPSQNAGDSPSGSLATLDVASVPKKSCSRSTPIPLGSEVLIKNYGLFWELDEVQWLPGKGNKRSFRLLGRQGKNKPGLRMADFDISWGSTFSMGTTARTMWAHPGAGTGEASQGSLVRCSCRMVESVLLVRVLPRAPRRRP